MQIFFWVLYIAIFILIYFIPTFVANGRNHKQKKPILILNFFLWWTWLIWVILLAWAVIAKENENDK